MTIVDTWGWGRGSLRARGVRGVRRAFTMVEAVLATVIAAMVVITAMTMLLGVVRVERTSRSTAQTSYELTRAHTAMMRALRQIVVSDGRAPATKEGAAGGAAGGGKEGGAGEGGANSPATPGGGSGGSGTGGRLPRANAVGAGGNTNEAETVRLTNATVRSTEGGRASSAGSGGDGRDEKYSGASGRGGSGGGTGGSGVAGGSEDSERSGRAGSAGGLSSGSGVNVPRLVLDSDEMGLPRLEMLVAESPVALPVGTDPALQRALTRGAFVLRMPEVEGPTISGGAGMSDQERMTLAAAQLRERLIRQQAEDAQKLVEAGFASGGGGVGGEGFGALPVGVDEKSAAILGRGFDLVWEVYPYNTQAGPDRQAITRVVLASGVTAMRWQFYKTNQQMQLEPRATASVTVKTDLPAYAEVELTMVSGRRVKWMFEIGWTVAGEPDAERLARDLNFDRANDPAGEEEGGARAASGSGSRDTGATPVRSGSRSGSGTGSGVDKERMHEQGRRGKEPN